MICKHFSACHAFKIFQFQTKHKNKTVIYALYEGNRGFIDIAGNYYGNDRKNHSKGVHNEDITLQLHTTRAIFICAVKICPN